jgi:hypothetical protein
MALHIRNLSPVDIITVPHDTISEPLASPKTFKQPSTSSSNSQKTQRSLRRSLFTADDNFLPICSTPMTSNRTKGRQFSEIILSPIASDIAMSPVRRTTPVRRLTPVNASLVIDPDDLDGLERIKGNHHHLLILEQQKAAADAAAAAAQKPVPVVSLAAIEQDLRIQYNIQSTPPLRRRSRRLSQDVPQTSQRFVNKSSTTQPKPAQRASKDVAPQPAPRTFQNSARLPTMKDCSVAVSKDMEIDSDIIELYKKQQKRRLSVSNRTDANSIHMIETPIGKRNQALSDIDNDSVIAFKLQLAENMNNAEFDEFNDTIYREKLAAHAAASKALMSKDKSSLMTEESDAEQAPNIEKEIEAQLAEMEKTFGSSTSSKRVEVGDKSLREKSKRVVEVIEEENEEESEEIARDESDEYPPESAPEAEESPSEEAEEEVEKIAEENLNKSAISSRSGKSIRARRISEAVNEISSSNRCHSRVGRSLRVSFVVEEEEVEAEVEMENNEVSEHQEEVKQMEVEEEQQEKVTSTSQQSFVRPAPSPLHGPNQSDSDTSLNRVISPRVVHSIRSLAKRRSDEHTNETVSSQASQSMKVNVPAKKRKTSVINPSTLSYLNLTAKNKKKKTSQTNKKRTLYTHEDDDEVSLMPPPPVPIMPSKSRQTQQQDDENIEMIEEQLEPIPEVESEAAAAPKVTKKVTKRKKQVSPEPESDEGFSSDQNDNDVRYDPYKNGCTRPGLRVRRIARPWWIHNGDEQNYGYVYSSTTKQDLISDKLYHKKMKKAKVVENNFLKSSLETWMKPADKLEIFEKAKKQLERGKSQVQFKVPAPKTKTKPKKKATQAQDEAGSTGSASTEMHSCYSAAQSSYDIFVEKAKAGNLFEKDSAISIDSETFSKFLFVI